MEKEQIVKALEICSNYQKFGDCGKCPARELCDEENNFLEKEALSLIREQEKRIEELETSCTELTRCCTMLETLYNVECKRVDTAKEDTVRKMHEAIKKRLMRGGIYPAFVACVIDNVAREMLEGGDNNDTE